MDHLGPALTAMAGAGAGQVSRGASRAVAALLGIGLLAAVVSGRAGLYVRAYFVPVLGLTGAALVVVAWRRPPRLSRRACTVLALPLAVALGIGPQQAANLSRGQLSGGLGARLGDGPNPLLSGGGVAVTLLQVDLAAEQVGPVALLGRQVAVQAEVASPSSLERLAMVCCAADARPVTLGVRGVHLPAPGRWVEVRGRLTATAGQVVLDATGVRTIPVPSQPIL